ncbi:hypothetical protein WJX81_006369 [Elliptochloris bilobata]|uniref:Uncharacterized protein n=1 Tax=Elliptochloris bilobata TaxID=381761 RepID=A0AAW1RZ22_9CHLO
MDRAAVEPYVHAAVRWLSSRGRDLSTGYTAVARITSGRGWPAPGERGRKNAYIVVETVLASILVVLLLTIVLGLPIGAVYLFLKAVSYFVGSFLSLPAVSNVLSALQRKAGL